MSNLVGIFLLVAFLAFAFAAATAGDHLVAFAFLLAVVATLAELLYGRK